jgi:hypothetical protein
LMAEKRATSRVWMQAGASVIPRVMCSMVTSRAKVERLLRQDVAYLLEAEDDGDAEGIDGVEDWRQPSAFAIPLVPCSMSTTSNARFEGGEPRRASRRSWRRSWRLVVTLLHPVIP